MDDQSSPEEASSGVWRRWRSQHIGLRWTINAFVIWVAIVLIIQIAAPNPEVDEMPTSCPEGSQNCVRVAHDATSFRSNGLEAPMIAAPVKEVHDAIMLWLNEEGGKSLKSFDDGESKTIFFHGVDRTDFWFFPDDLYVQIVCDEQGVNSEVTLQSISRLGIGDMGVNHNRLSDLITYLDSNDWSGEMCEIVG